MPRQEFRLGFGDIRELVFEGFGDTGVQRAPRPAQQGAVCSILYQRMLEQVGRMRRHTLPKQQTGSSEALNVDWSSASGSLTTAASNA